VDTIGPWELLIIVLAIGLLFGANGLPQMACSLARGCSEVGRECLVALGNTRFHQRRAG
jgi:Sec-independent protein translocase protein TatA